MAVFTSVDREAASGIAEAYGLGELRGLVPIEAGTVNTNHFIETAAGRHFLRVYEQQQEDGVRYEWKLLSHLKAKGLPVAAPLPGVAPGALRVAGKPVAVFDLLCGESLCQARVSSDRAGQLGSTLATTHDACQDFPEKQPSRFALADVRGLLVRARQAGREELGADLDRLEGLADELERLDLLGLPQGVIHGDLFRDNVLWAQDGQLSGLLDWESASDGALGFDLAVTLLAWCCGDCLDWSLAGALVGGYQTVRPLSDVEWNALPDLLRLGCLRFATTRILDVYLPGGRPDRYKNYRRFIERLERVEALEEGELRRLLGG